MNIGVSTGCYFPSYTVDALKSVAETGAKYAEIFFNTEDAESNDISCSEKDILAAINELKTGIRSDRDRNEIFSMRPEQQAAVEKTKAYFDSALKENSKQSPKFLWNAKMRFGKTFATYQLAKQMGWTKILVLTFKPAVHQAWEEDLNSHCDFDGWQFISKKDKTTEQFMDAVKHLDSNRPIVCFGSFQDYLGKNDAGGIKAQNEWVHGTNWDCVVFDEYHYGAWRENAKDLFENESKAEQKNAAGEAMDYFDESNMPITTGHYLYLSGTPFRAINSGEFIEEQIYNWTYSDEQREKEEWKGPNNPYAALPRMVMMTYQLPDTIRNIALGGEFNEFNLNEFFSADSIHFADSLKFTTPRGRVVYGGGGIIPDIFVPMDTTLATRFYVDCNRKTTQMRFAQAMFDKYRGRLSDIDDFAELERFLNQIDLGAQFLDYAARVDGLKPKEGEWEETAEYLMPQLKALVGRFSKLEDEAFYRFYLPIDDTIQAALKNSSVVEFL